MPSKHLARAIGASMGCALLSLIAFCLLLIWQHNLRRRRDGYAPVGPAYTDRHPRVKRESALMLMARLNRAEAHMSVLPTLSEDEDEEAGRPEGQLSVIATPSSPPMRLSVVDEEAEVARPEGHLSVFLRPGVNATQDVRMDPEANIELASLGRREGSQGW